MRVIGVADGVTVEQACSALPDYKKLFSASSRGVLVRNPAGLATFELARKLECHSSTLFYNLEDGTFSCVTRGPGRLAACFTTGKPIPTYAPIDSILGEVTLDGVMRVLDISRRLLFTGAGARSADKQG
jgi:hypothetical protein